MRKEGLQWFGLGSLSLTHNLERPRSELGPIAASSEFVLGIRSLIKAEKRKSRRRVKEFE